MSIVTVTKTHPYKDLLNQIIELENNSESSTAELWLGMAEILNKTKIEKIKIWAIVAKDIEDALWLKSPQDIPREEFKWVRHGYFYRVGKKHGYVDSDSDEIALGQPKIVPPPTEYEIENYEYITLIYETIDFLRNTALQKLKHNHFTSLVKSKDVKLTLHDWRAQLKIAESFFDHKEKVPINLQHILLHCIATMASNNDAAQEYFRLRDKAHTLTSKQLSKYRKGVIKNRPAIYNPRDRDTAMMWDYIGIQCKNKKCGSWRVIELPGTGIIFRAGCLECEESQVVVQPIKCNTCTVLFFEDDIAKLKDKTKCPYCKEEFSSIVIDKMKTF